MQVTVFSFFVAVVWSAVVALIMCFFIKKRYFVRIFGISSILSLYFIPFIRVMLPVEFSFTKVITNVFLWNKLYEYLCIDKIMVFDKPMLRIYLLLIIYFAGVLVCTILFAMRYTRAVIKIERLDFLCNIREKDALERVLQTLNKPFNIKLLIASEAESPMAMGVLHKKIILPAQTYSDEELYFVLLHEVTHFLNHDLLLKILVQALCCVFWWNPIVYLLQKDLEQVLEIKCDLAVVKEMDKEQKVTYLSTIINVIKQQKTHFKKHGFEVASLIGSNQEKSLVERFKIVSDEKKNVNSVAAKVVWNIGIVCAIFLSYLFVIQPIYDAPVEEIVTEEDVYEMNPENTVLVQQRDGNYLVIHESGYQEVIEKEIAESLIAEGFKTRKESSSEKSDMD